MRNHEHYIEPAAYAAIKRADRPRKKPRYWGDNGWGSDERHLTECRVAFLLLYIELRYIMEKISKEYFYV